VMGFFQDTVCQFAQVGIESQSSWSLPPESLVILIAFLCFSFLFSISVMLIPPINLQPIYLLTGTWPVRQLLLLHPKASADGFLVPKAWPEASPCLGSCKNGLLLIWTEMDCTF
jgi:hypothetical protein